MATTSLFLSDADYESERGGNTTNGQHKTTRSRKDSRKDFKKTGNVDSEDEGILEGKESLDARANGDGKELASQEIEEDGEHTVINTSVLIKFGLPNKLVCYVHDKITAL